LSYSTDTLKLNEQSAYAFLPQYLANSKMVTATEALQNSSADLNFSALS